MMSTSRKDIRISVDNWQRLVDIARDLNISMDEAVDTVFGVLERSLRLNLDYQRSVDKK